MQAAYQSTTTSGEYTQSIPVKAAVIIAAGALFAVDASGRAVPATDASAVRIAGRALTEYDNSAVGAVDGDVSARAERLTYALVNSAVTPLVAADVLKPCFLEGPGTVCKTRPTDEPVAGIFLGFDGLLAIVQVINFPMAAAPVLTCTNNTAANAVDLPALKLECEKISDDLRALHASLMAVGLIG